MENFIPDIYQKSIYHIDYDKLLDDGTSIVPSNCLFLIVTFI